MLHEVLLLLMVMATVVRRSEAAEKCAGLLQSLQGHQQHLPVQLLLQLLQVLWLLVLKVLHVQQQAALRLLLVLMVLLLLAVLLLVCQCWWIVPELQLDRRCLRGLETFQ
jgi:TRAP-type uncharacterized transport system fused permease subunit